MAYSILTSECKQTWVLFEMHNLIKLVFEVTNNIQSCADRPLTTSPHFACNIYKPVSLQNRIYFGTGLKHMAARPHGNGTNLAEVVM